MHYAIDRTRHLEAATVRYFADGEGNRITVRAFAMGLLASFGHNPTIAVPDFEGEILLNPDEMDRSSLRLVFHSASLTVTDDISTKDRDEINRKMHGEVLESDLFPDIVFECSGVSASHAGEGQYQVLLNGQLTLHGVSHMQVVSARVSLGGNTLRATGDFSVRQSDYEIRPVSAAGGAVKLRDELKLSFDISARKQT